MTKGKRLGVGFVGTAKAHTHLQGWARVPDADLVGVWPAGTAAKRYGSIEAMVADPAIDALWLLGDHDGRAADMEEIADAVLRAKGKLIGVASETPLGRNVAEAERMTALAAHAGVKHALLAHLTFAAAITAGRSAAWARGHPRAVRVVVAPGDRSNAERDAALCQALIVGRFLLTLPGATLSSLQPRHVTRQGDSIDVVYESRDGLELHASALTGPRHAVEVDQTALMLNLTEDDGHVAQNAHYVRAFLGQDDPLLTFEDGFDAIRLLDRRPQDPLPTPAL